MTPRPARLPVFAFTLTALVALLVGSVCAQSTPASPPPVDPSENTVRSPDAQVAAALVASTARIRPGENVKVQIVNRGQVALNHGRPVVVERWTGSAWEETSDSRNTAWTMELLQIEPGRSGVEQAWPFQSESKPAPGWYRFSKDLYATDKGGAPVRLVVRTRVEVVVP